MTYVDQELPLKKKDLIICLGGGVNEEGCLARHIQSRVRKSIDISSMSNDAVILFSSSFTLNKPPVMDSRERIVSEASVMAKFAKSLGYQSQLYCEQQSHDTIGSAYFSFSDFVSFIRPKTITIVTSNFHIERARVIFSHVAELFNFEGRLLFAETTSSFSQVRSKKERSSCQEYYSYWKNIKDISEYRYKFFRYHSNYNIDFASKLYSPIILKSY